jgi:hypothetical protein
MTAALISSGRDEQTAREARRIVSRLASDRALEPLPGIRSLGDVGALAIRDAEGSGICGLRRAFKAARPSARTRRVEGQDDGDHEDGRDESDQRLRQGGQCTTG